MTLVAFHGYGHNGAVMREMLAPLDLGEVVCADGTHACNPESVARLAQALGQPIPPAPNLCWWDATDDGKVYRGWDETRAALAALLERHAPRGILGFSQGAIVASAVCALSAAGELPPIRYAVIVAGRLPRAEALRPYFAKPIAVPSLHVVGTRDLMTPAVLSDDLASRFVGADVCKWNGPHVVPSRGPGKVAIESFVRRVR